MQLAFNLRINCTQVNVSLLVIVDHTLLMEVSFVLQVLHEDIYWHPNYTMEEFDCCP